MSNLGKLLAPKPIRKQISPFCDNNSPKRSSNQFNISAKNNKQEIMKTKESIMKTSTTLLETDSKFSNFESELSNEICRNEISSIIFQREEKIPFELCEEYSNTEEVERVSNPFYQNLSNNNDDYQYSENQRIDINQLTFSKDDNSKDDLE